MLNDQENQREAISTPPRHEEPGKGPKFPRIWQTVFSSTIIWENILSRKLAEVSISKSWEKALELGNGKFENVCSSETMGRVD